MNLNITNNKGEKIRPIIGHLRRTQLITSFGAGAVVDLPEMSVIMAGIDLWPEPSEDDIFHENNLERLLKVSYFAKPHSSDNQDSNGRDIPAFRFPTMYFCPHCGRLQPYWKLTGGKENRNKCAYCDGSYSIVPSRFVAACINGHIEDFPYNWWVHKGDFSKNPLCREKPDLSIRFSSKSGGLESIIIKCNICGKERSMEGCMSKGALAGYRCHGKRPWLDGQDERECNASMVGLQRGGSNVYYPHTESALTIPPYSTRINEAINKHWGQVKAILENQCDEKTLHMLVSVVFVNELKRGKFSEADLSKAIQKKLTSPDNPDYSRQNLREDEYKVFVRLTKVAYDSDKDVIFKGYSAGVPERLKGYISDIDLITRLREVLALTGFRRIIYENRKPDDPDMKGWNQKKDVIPLSGKEKEWLPAIEMLGEGIFIRLNEKRVAEWDEKMTDYYAKMGNRLKESGVQCDNFSPRYVLLHTLAHLLIRQLTIECGYSGASIKERIYSKYKDSDVDMCGILLYTSTSDSDGSLGGLVRNGRQEQFENVFFNMLHEASWCSADPVCIRNKANGYDSLNYAACYACTLLPETCCEMRNCLLDRASVIGGLTNQGERDGEGYFSDLLGGI